MHSNLNDSMKSPTKQAIVMIHIFRFKMGRMYDSALFVCMYDSAMFFCMHNSEYFIVHRKEIEKSINKIHSLICNFYRLVIHSRMKSSVRSYRACQICILEECSLR